MANDGTFTVAVDPADPSKGHRPMTEAELEALTAPNAAPVAAAVATPPQPPTPAPAAAAGPDQEFEPEYIFRLRRFKGGNFRNLWESTMLDPVSCRKIEVIKVLDDANALNFCMDNVQGHIEGEGF